MLLQIESYKKAKIEALSITCDREPGYVGILVNQKGECTVTDFLSMSTSYDDED